MSEPRNPSGPEARGTAPSSLRAVDPGKRHGQLGESWGNLLLPASELALDEAFAFTGEEPPVVYTVTRVNVWPLDASQRLFHYENRPR